MKIKKRLLKQLIESFLLEDVDISDLGSSGFKEFDAEEMTKAQNEKVQKSLADNQPKVLRTKISTFTLDANKFDKSFLSDLYGGSGYPADKKNIEVKISYLEIKIPGEDGAIVDTSKPTFYTLNSKNKAESGNSEEKIVVGILDKDKKVYKAEILIQKNMSKDNIKAAAYANAINLVREKQ